MRRNQDNYATTKTSAKEVPEYSKTTAPIEEPRSFRRTDWKERIDRAKAAREFGKKLRDGKPVTFQSSVGWRR